MNEKNSDPLAVAFAPDWSGSNPYQFHLKGALQREQISVSYIQEEKWGLALAKAALSGKMRLIHLHWPEAFFSPTRRPGGGMYKKLRYWFDFQRASARCPFVLTAHNLYPHNRRDEPLVRSLVRMTYAKARAIIAHSAAAAEVIEKEFPVDPDKLHVIPHGTDTTSVSLVMKLSALQARTELGLEKAKDFCLIFGAIKPYKGIEEVIRFWKTHSPDCDLRIVGFNSDPAYDQSLKHLKDGNPGIHFHGKWLSDNELTLWLRAANCTLFNYKRILTSGAAVYARSLGVPILLPHQLGTIDLGEPHPLVRRFWRFDLDFEPALQATLSSRANYSQAEEFRRQTSWSEVAKLTAKVYLKSI